MCIHILFLFPMSTSEVAASHSSTIPKVTAASDNNVKVSFCMNDLMDWCVLIKQQEDTEEEDDVRFSYKLCLTAAVDITL